VLAAGMSTMSSSQSGVREGGAQRENKDKKFAARRVPDFARLHAMEDARVARYTIMSTPFDFPLSTALPLSVLAATCGCCKEELGSGRPNEPIVCCVHGTHCII
jgi:hypothetical protein